MRITIKIGLFTLLLTAVLIAVNVYMERVFISTHLKNAYLREKELDAQPNIDLLFLGSSHCYRHYAPQVFDNLLGINSFNYGASSQTANLTRFSLKNIYRKGYKPKVVIIDVYFYLYLRNDYTSHLAYDYLPCTVMLMLPVKERFRHHNDITMGKTNLILNTFKLYQETFAEDIVRSLFPGIARNPEQEKLVYARKGFVESYHMATPDELGNSAFVQGVRGIPLLDFDPILLNELGKTITLAQKNGAHVIMLASPLPEQSLEVLRDYPKIHKVFADIAGKTNVPFLDFNMVRPIPLELNDFYDGDHLNKNGAIKFSTYIATWLRDKGYIKPSI